MAKDPAPIARPVRTLPEGAGPILVNDGTAPASPLRIVGSRPRRRVGGDHEKATKP